MNYLRPCVQAWLISFVKLFAPFVVGWLVWRDRIIWDATPTLDLASGRSVVRGDLPLKYRAIWQTPDERLPGGLYEPTVLKWLDKYGPKWCSFLWLGMRNRAHGFATRFEKPMTNHFNAQVDYKDKTGVLRLDGLWQLYVSLGPFCFLAGYRSYHTPERSYYGVPVFGFKRS